MAKTVAIDVKINAEEGAKSLKDLKQDLKDLQNQISKTKEGSEEYYQVLKQIGSTKDEIDDLKDAIAATTGAGQFQAIANVGEQIATGFQMAQAAMAIFGSESEELQQHLQKAQAAIAFVQGIKQLEGFADAFKNFKNVVLDFDKATVETLKNFKKSAVDTLKGITDVKFNDAMSLMKGGITGFAKSGIAALRQLWAAMLSNPITAILVGLAALASGIAFLMTRESAEEKQLKSSIATREKLLNTLENESQSRTKLANNIIALMKAQGASDEKLYEAEKARDKTRIQDLDNQKTKLNEHLKDLHLLRQKAKKEEIQDLDEKIAETNKKLQSAYNEQYDISWSQTIKEAELRKKAKDKEDEEAKKKADEQKQKSKEAFDKSKADAEKEAALRKELNDKLAQLRIDNIDDERKAAKEKENLDYENQVKEYKTKFAGKKELNDLLFELEMKHKNALSEIDNKFNIQEQQKEDEKRKKREEEEQARLAREKEAAEKLREERLKQLELDRLNITKYRELTIDDEVLLETKRYEILRSNKELSNQDLQLLEAEHLNKIKELADKKHEEDKKRDEEELARKKLLADTSLEITKSGLQAIGDLSSAFAGKSKAEQKKAFEIQKGVNIAMATIDTYKAAQSAYASGSAVGGPVLGAISAAIAVAAGIANIRKIEQTKFEDKSTPTSGGGGGAGGGTFSPSLGAPVSSTSTNLASIGFGDNQPNPVKVFVTETDISSNQNKVKSIEQKASIE